MDNTINETNEKAAIAAIIRRKTMKILINRKIATLITRKTTKIMEIMMMMLIKWNFFANIIIFSTVIQSGK